MEARYLKYSTEEKAKVSRNSERPLLSDFKDLSEPSIPERPRKIHTLNLISEFMQNKKLRKLTRQDLEEICLMKMCEGITYKSETGELKRQLDAQKQLTDVLMTKVTGLVKEVRKLENVLKTLLENVRQNKDHYIPMKINRSVALQVGHRSQLVTPQVSSSSSLPVTSSSSKAPSIIDLSESVEAGSSSTVVKPHVEPANGHIVSVTPQQSMLEHSAPLPPQPLTQMSITARKPPPPKPHLTIRGCSSGIILSWKMPYTLDKFELIASYQLYSYQESKSSPSSDMWRKVGELKALPLPMTCTLTQFAKGNKYHFAVRAVDVQKRMGAFSDPQAILL